MIAAIPGPAVLAFLLRLVPAVREAIRATRKASPDGKRITRAERDRIVAVLLGGVVEVAEGNGGLFVGLDIEADDPGVDTAPSAPRRRDRPEG